ncbi:membrane metallo-endopeptidase-like 1 [Exaiptasia diaphana]|uniref:Uncharacterized protein n=1 Tax=Exaiptasia diaphana TaxID=2652724 RepID=A0A913X0W0_EXADI|nr:membrane metallo-endopeptidase-like 1 [Exaiptasia diaphana]KXJ16296.1 Membrane metallo-endopeptidase-like 1 [Exaiptasia diaphana]
MTLRFLIVVVLVWSVCGQGNQSLKVCRTKACKRTAKNILSSMDQTVQPCEDFYQYACGKWIRNNPAQDGEMSVDRYEKLRASNDEFVKNLMADSQSRHEYSKIKAIIKAFEYYDSCMNVTVIENRGVQPIRALLSKYSILVDNSWDETNWNLEDVVIRLLEDLGTKALFEINVELGMRNNSFYFISLKQPSKFNLPRGTRKAKRDSFFQFMVNITQELGTGTTKVDLKKVIGFERTLAKIALPESNMDYRKMKMSELENELGVVPIDWMYVLQEVIPSGSITNDTVIIMNGLSYFKKLMKLLDNKITNDKRTLANYIMWKVVYNLHLKLGQTFWDFHGNYKNAIGENWSQVDREDTCMEELTSLKGFALPLTRVFVDKKFKGGNKKWILRATERIRNMFVSNLQDNTWMDDDTYTNATAKAKSLKEVIGYPDFIMDNTALDAEYNDVVIDETKFFENYLSLVKFLIKKQYRMVGKPRDDLGWSMSPLEINAQYEDSFNRMVFPVAILQPPFYSGEYSSAVNFGGLGTVIGHEMTHGFDDSGKNYDKMGRRDDWWSKVTLDEFKKKSKCLVNQYSGYTFHRRNVNGRKSLSENIADNGGIKLALSAYRDWVQENGDEPVLPGTKLTNEQLFFVSFAQNWCSSFSNEGIKQELTSNYSPSPVRVNGSLKNFKDFASVFQCKPGAPMNPTIKCGLW